MKQKLPRDYGARRLEQCLLVPNMSKCYIQRHEMYRAKLIKQVTNKGGYFGSNEYPREREDEKKGGEPPRVGRLSEEMTPEPFDAIRGLRPTSDSKARMTVSWTDTRCDPMILGHNSRNSVAAPEEASNGDKSANDSGLDTSSTRLTYHLDLVQCKVRTRCRCREQDTLRRRW